MAMVSEPALRAAGVSSESDFVASSANESSWGGGQSDGKRPCRLKDDGDEHGMRLSFLLGS